MTRREFIGMGSVAVVAIAVAGRYALVDRIPEPPTGTFPVRRSEAQWRAMLAPASYHVLREAGTERRFSSPLLKEHRKGFFACAGCGKHVFASDAKYDSHTGWPSFWQALPGAVVDRADHKFGRLRTEIICTDCGGHLGHVFKDGPKPTGLRYCINGVALTFVAATA